MIFARILFKHKETFKFPCTKQLILLYRRINCSVQKKTIFCTRYFLSV